MKKAKHSPLPLVAQDIGTGIALHSHHVHAGRYLAVFLRENAHFKPEGGQGETALDIFPAEENAAFGLKAMNNHYQIMNALRRLLRVSDKKTAEYREALALLESLEQ